LNPDKHLIILAPTAPPEVCGVSDFAWQTAKALKRYYTTVIIGVYKKPSNDLVIDPEISVAGWKGLLAHASSLNQAHDVLINYTPTAYGVLGWPIELIKAIGNLKKANAGNKVFIFFHETWDGSSHLKLHHTIRNKLVKHAIILLGALADGITVVTKDQQQKLERILDCYDIRMGRIGSNILPPYPEKGLNSERKIGKWIIFGLAHTRLWTIQAHMPLLKAF